MYIIYYIFFATFILLSFNGLTDALCSKREIPEERQPKVFHTINFLITLLLLNSLYRFVEAGLI